MSPPAACPDPAAGSARAARDARLAAWVEAAARGDAAAFEAFYDTTIDHAQALARRFVSQRADAEDLLADAYFDAWRQAARFDATRGSAVSWLLAIVRNRAIDLLRRRGAGAAETPIETATEDSDPGANLWRLQAGGLLEAALRDLRPAERWVLGLAYFREMSQREIAAATGLPLGTVKTAILRGQARLRSALAR